MRQWLCRSGTSLHEATRPLTQIVALYRELSGMPESSISIGRSSRVGFCFPLGREFDIASDEFPSGTIGIRTTNAYGSASGRHLLSQPLIRCAISAIFPDLTVFAVMASHCSIPLFAGNRRGITLASVGRIGCPSLLLLLMTPHVLLALRIEMDAKPILGCQGSSQTEGCDNRQRTVKFSGHDISAIVAKFVSEHL